MPVKAEERQFACALLFTWAVAFVLLSKVGESDAVSKVDFTIFYSGARVVLEGNADRFYDLSVQSEIQERLFGRANPMPFNHLPYELLPFLPLGLLPLRIAYTIFGAVNAGIAIAIVVLLQKDRSAAIKAAETSSERQVVRSGAVLLEPRNPLALTLFVILFLPVWVALGQGQDSLLLLFFIVLAYRHLTRGHFLAAGFFIGLTVFKFQIALPLLALLLLRGGRRFALGATCAIASVLIVSIALVGWNELLEYPAFIVQMDQGDLSGTMEGRKMSNLRGFTETIAGAKVPLLLHVVLHVTFGLLALLLCWRSRLPDSRYFGVAVLIAAILSYHMYTHDLSLLLLPLLIALQNRDETGWREVALLVCFGSIFAPWIHGYESLLSLIFFGIAGMTALNLSSQQRNLRPSI